MGLQDEQELESSELMQKRRPFALQTSVRKKRYFTPTGKELTEHTSKPSEKVSHKDFFFFFF